MIRFRLKFVFIILLFEKLYEKKEISLVLGNITKEDIEKIERGIREGCPTDAPGSFISWLCEQSEVYAYEMPGNRFDVGSIEGYESIKKEFFR